MGKREVEKIENGKWKMGIRELEKREVGKREVET